MFYLNVVDEEENRILNESALYSKTTYACEKNGIDFSIKHQQEIQAVDKYKDRPEVIKLILASGNLYEEMDYIYIENTDEWICMMKFEDTKTMVLISKDTFTFKYQYE
jgi:hypothetical protein